MVVNYSSPFSSVYTLLDKWLSDKSDDDDDEEFCSKEIWSDICFADKVYFVNNVR